MAKLPTLRELEVLTNPMGGGTVRRPGRPRIALCMIVKNEAAVVERLVASVARHIDYYVICDTGSTDGTQALLQSTLADAGVDGELHQREWVDFGHNRSEMLKLARGKADWLLLLDADWTLQVEWEQPLVDPLSLTQLGDGIWIDCWLVAAAGGFQMTHKVLLQGDKPWKAVGKIHELIDCDDPFEQALLNGVTWTHHADSGTRDTRAESDRELLLAAIEEDPNDSRSIFYLAQTLKDMGRTEEAVGYYLRRAELGGWEQETYLSLLYAGRLAALVDGNAFTETDRLGLFFRAWGLLPDRLEALYELVSWLRVNHQHQAAWTLLRRPLLGRDYVTPADGVFAEGWIADYGLRFEESIVAYWIGEHAHAVEACEMLLEDDRVPVETKVQVWSNRSLSIAELGRGSA